VKDNFFYICLLHNFSACFILNLSVDLRIGQKFLNSYVSLKVLRAHFVRSQQIFPLFVSQLSLFSRSKSDEKQDEKTEERVNLGRKRSRKRTISKDRRQSLHYEDTMATYLLIQLSKVGTVSPKPVGISCLYSSLFSCLDSCLGSCSFRPTSCLFSWFDICFVSCFVSC